MNTYIDIYCERIEPGLWAEPVNALTNLSFFVAAFLVWRLARAEKAARWPAPVLALLIAVIGTGSALFHTFAVHWTMLADVLPILLYQIVFITVYANNVMKAGCGRSATLLGGFFVTIYLFGLLPAHWLNGSLSYAPAFLFLGGLALWHIRNVRRERFGLAAAAGVFALSLTFRSADMALCPVFALGTHFLWHLLNGLVLYLTARAYILNENKSVPFTGR